MNGHDFDSNNVCRRCKLHMISAAYSECAGEEFKPETPQSNPGKRIDQMTLDDFRRAINNTHPFNKWKI